MDSSTPPREPNLWTLPSLTLGVSLLLIGLVGSWTYWAFVAPFAFLGLAMSTASVRNARRIGGGLAAARLAVLTCALALLAGLAACGAMATGYNGL